MTDAGLSPEQVSAFRRDGFLNAGRLLSDAELDALGSDLDRIIAAGPDGFPEDGPRPVRYRAFEPERPVWQILNVWEASPLFERLVYHPAIVTGISQLTGFADLQVWHDQVQYKPARSGGATGWHQDAPLWPSIDPMTPVSAWLPFDDADVANGCMWMVPGSHRWGDRQQEYLRSLDHLRTVEEFGRIGEGFVPPEDAEIREVAAVPRPVRRGEVHFHHSLTWHGSPENDSPRRRRALAIHYMTGAARFTGRDHVMRPFIKLAVGEPMAKAGKHFPMVCRGGVPLPAPVTPSGRRSSPP